MTEKSKNVSMSWRSFVAVMLAMAFVLPAGASFVGTGEGTIFEDTNLIENDRIEISLSGYRFDPIVDAYPIEDLWRLDRPNGHYLVQLYGNIYPEHRQAIEDAGADIISYVPDYAYLVNMDETARANVESLDIVRWVGYFEPGYKVSPFVKDKIGTYDGETTIIITLFDAPGSNIESLFTDDYNRMLPQGIVAFPEVGEIPENYAQMKAEIDTSIMNPVDLSEGRIESNVKPFTHTPIEWSLGQFALDTRLDRLTDGVFDEGQFISHNRLLMERAQQVVFEIFVDELGGQVTEWVEYNQAAVT
ncbi:MAG: hypothetical protein QCI38_02770, partial [Candidatus Thermoplasmatota archaeon]|nr:hypothetical protein [Candidatus Thermoplasmatota archaeon]